jgi:tetratricopeptide (TPR) repeat protein
VWVQLIFDELSSWLAVMLPAVCGLAWIAVNAPRPRPGWPRVALGWLALPTLLLTGAAGWGLWGYQPFASSLEFVKAQDWRKAAELASESARRDPAFHFYQVQAGVLWSWAWQADRQPASLASARAYLSRAVIIEPNLSWVWADLAVLDAAAGEPQVALADFNRAIAISPNMAAYFLNRAAFLEQTGSPTAAAADYTACLRLHPDWAGSLFWQSSTIRQAALRQFQADKGAPAFVEPPGYLQIARQSITFQQFSTAQNYLDKARLMGEPGLAVAVTQAQLARALGDLSAARLAAQVVRAILDRDRFLLVEDIDFYYSSFIANRAGAGINLVPGFLQLREAVGQDEFSGK